MNEYTLSEEGKEEIMEWGENAIPLMGFLEEKHVRLGEGII